MMKREIKFRAWDGEEMIILPLAGLQYFDFEGSYVLSFAVDGYDGFWAHEQYDGPSDKASKFPIMQYTGLKDKNGKEIYEGDILRRYFGVGYSSKNYPSFKDGTQKCEVIEAKWCFDKFGFTELAQPNDTNFGFEFEIIGNIYSNPELLK